MLGILTATPILSHNIPPQDAIQVLGSAFGITTASIALLRALPAGPTAGVTSAQISANLAANGRRLQQNDDESTATFEAFSKAQLANGTVQDVYSRWAGFAVGLSLFSTCVPHRVSC